MTEEEIRDGSKIECCGEFLTPAEPTVYGPYAVPQWRCLKCGYGFGGHAVKREYTEDEWLRLEEYLKNRYRKIYELFQEQPNNKERMRLRKAVRKLWSDDLPHMGVYLDDIMIPRKD